MRTLKYSVVCFILVLLLSGSNVCIASFHSRFSESKSVTSLCNSSKFETNESAFAPRMHWKGFGGHNFGRKIHFSHWGGNGGYRNEYSNILGSQSMILGFTAPLALLAYGSAAGISLTAVGFLLGAFGLGLDGVKKNAKTGIIVCAGELVILGVLYSMYLI